MNSPAAAPVAVWDAKDRPPGWTDANTREMIQWAREHIDRVNDTYRVEFYAADPPFVVVHRYRRNENGRKFALTADGEPAREEPATVTLDELPPAHLLRTA